MMQPGQLPVSLDHGTLDAECGHQRADTEGVWVVQKFPYTFCPGSPLVNI